MDFALTRPSRATTLMLARVTLACRRLANASSTKSLATMATFAQRTDATLL